MLVLSALWFGAGVVCLVNGRPPEATACGAFACWHVHLLILNQLLRPTQTPTIPRSG